MSHLSLRERFTAEAGAWITRHPHIRETFFGVEPRRVRLIDFHVAATPADELDIPTFRGNAEAGKKRPVWPFGVLAVNAEAFSSELGRPQYQRGRRAFVFTVGNAALVGAIPDYDLHRWNQGVPQIGGHVGDNDVKLGAAIWLPDNTLVVPEGGCTVAPRLDVRRDAEIIQEPDPTGRYLPQYRTAGDVPGSVSLY